jgi:hypothetical protein
VRRRLAARRRRRTLQGIALLAVAGLELSRAGPARAQADDPAAPAPPPADPTAPPPPPPPEPAAPPPPSLDELVDALDDEHRVPDNPALDILDASLDVVKPGATKDLATDLRALYAGGKVVPQVAIELSPYALAFGRRTTYDDYRRRAYVPILHRLAVSIATTSTGEGDAQATIGAIGVRLRLFDRSDWRLDKAAVSCAMDAAKLAKPPSQAGTSVIVVVDDEATKQEAQKVQACFDKAKARRGTWNAAQLALGGALSSAFPGGKLQWDLRDLTAWIGWGNRLGRTGHLVVAGKYIFSDVRKDGDARLPAAHTGAVSVEVERRSDRFGLLGSVGAGLRWTDDALAMQWARAWVGLLAGEVQVRATGATWVALRISAQVVEDGDGTFVSLANFKWNFDVKPSKAK